MVLDLIQKDDYFTSIDLQDAYFSVPIHEHDQKFLKFRLNGALYKFVCLPFGLSPAPKLFTKILRPIYAWFRFMGIRCSYYIDDSINMHQIKEICLQNSNRILDTLRLLGFTINVDKSVLHPSQKIVFFGFVIDSVQFMVFLTVEKIQRILTDAETLLHTRHVRVREIASFIGRLVNAFFAILEAPLH